MVATRRSIIHIRWELTVSEGNTTELMKTLLALANYNYQPLEKQN